MKTYATYQETMAYGSPQQQCKLAKKIEREATTDEELYQAAQLYIKSAEAGYHRSAKVFRTDYGYIRKSREKESRLVIIRMAAQSGYAAAQCALGFRYMNGMKVEKDARLAFEWFSKSAEQDYPDALFFLGLLYKSGKGVNKDSEKSLDLIETAAYNGSAAAQFEMGSRCLKHRQDDPTHEIAFRWFMLSATQGNIASQRKLGQMFRDGSGTERSSSEAIKWLTFAANNGDKNALYEIGLMYEKGYEDLRQDYKTAVEYYQEAMKNKDIMSAYRLGEMYEYGIYFNINIEKASELYREAAEKGYKKAVKKLSELSKEKRFAEPLPSGSDMMGVDEELFQKILNHYPPSDQYELGKRLEEGHSVRKDLRRAALLYIRAAESGHPKAIKVFEFDFNRKKQMSVNKDRFDVIRYAAEARYAQAQYSLGGRYRRGIDVPKDYDLAFEWFSKATEQGHADAQFYLGAMYRKGRAVEQDLKKADELTEAAAFRGCAEAQHEMGKKFELGINVKKNLEVAFKWYMDSARNGYFMSVYRIGEMYRDGKGTEHSSSKAIEWFTKSAEMGYRIAWFSIGQMYEIGYDDLKQDLKTAVEYYQIAKKHGYFVATFHLGQMYERGIYFEQDVDKATMLYKESADTGYVPAKQKLSQMNRKG